MAVKDPQGMSLPKSGRANAPHRPTSMLPLTLRTRPPNNRQRGRADARRGERHGGSGHDAPRLRCRHRALRLQRCVDMVETYIEEVTCIGLFYVK
eukprot:52377-Eustigmatos_ZCMA.PRE.1